jgi:hypothetical protein
MVSDKKIILKTNPSYVVLYQIKKKKLRNSSSDSVTTSDQDFFLCKNSIFSYFSKQIHLMFVLYQIKKKTLRNPSLFSNIGKANNLKVFGNKKTKGPQENSQNLLMLPMQEGFIYYCSDTI